jgi:hypothetical protein
MFWGLLAIFIICLNLGIVHLSWRLYFYQNYKFMKKIYLLLTAAVLSFNVFAQDVALVTSTGTTTLHNTFMEAYAAASNGDFIYLPGGEMAVDFPLVNGKQTISKKINVYGAGIHLDSTNVTKRTRIFSVNASNIPNIYIDKNGSNSYFEGLDFYGVRFDQSIYSTDTVYATFNNCLFGNSSNGSTPLDFFAGAGAYANFTFNNCNINGSVRGPAVNNFTTTYNNCLISGLYSVYYATINNCVIFAYDSLQPSPMGNYTNFTNCIFANMPNWNSNGLGHLPNYCTYTNCVFSGNNFVAQSSGIGNTSTGCVYSVGMSNLFNNTMHLAGTGNVFWNYSYDFHLKTGSLALTAGVGGIQCGLYGGSFPSKLGWVPSNPHISSATIPPTAANGSLNVTIKAIGQ